MEWTWTICGVPADCVSIGLVPVVGRVHGHRRDSDRPWSCRYFERDVVEKRRARVDGSVYLARVKESTRQVFVTPNGVRCCVAEVLTCWRLEKVECGNCYLLWRLSLVPSLR